MNKGRIEGRKAVVACVLAIDRIGRADRSNGLPVNRLMTGCGKGPNPAGRQIHVDQKLHPSTGQMDFASLRETGGESESFPDVLLL